MKLKISISVEISNKIVIKDFHYEINNPNASTLHSELVTEVLATLKHYEDQVDYP